MNILDTLVRVNRRGEMLYFYHNTPREVCVDILGGVSDDRGRVVALLAQTQAMARILLSLAHNSCTCTTNDVCLACRARDILRNALVLP